MIEIPSSIKDHQIVFCLAGQLRELGLNEDPDIAEDFIDCPDNRPVRVTAGKVRRAQRRDQSTEREPDADI